MSKENKNNKIITKKNIGNIIDKAFESDEDSDNKEIDIEDAIKDNKNNNKGLIQDLNDGFNLVKNFIPNIVRGILPTVRNEINKYDSVTTELYTEETDDIYEEDIKTENKIDKDDNKSDQVDLFYMYDSLNLTKTKLNRLRDLMLKKDLNKKLEIEKFKECQRLILLYVDEYFRINNDSDTYTRKVMEILYNKSETSGDMRLILSNGKVIRVHRKILIKYEYFNALLKSNMLEQNMNEINFKEYKSNCVKKILKYMYTGNIPELKTIERDEKKQWDDREEGIMEEDLELFNLLDMMLLTNISEKLQTILFLSEKMKNSLNIIRKYSKYFNKLSKLKSLVFLSLSDFISSLTTNEICYDILNESAIKKDNINNNDKKYCCKHSKVYHNIEVCRVSKNPNEINNCCICSIYFDKFEDDNAYDENIKLNINKIEEYLKTLNESDFKLVNEYIICNTSAEKLYINESFGPTRSSKNVTETNKKVLIEYMYKYKFYDFYNNLQNNPKNENNIGSKEVIKKKLGENKNKVTDID